MINHDNNLDNLVMENKYYLKGDQIQFFYIDCNIVWGGTTLPVPGFNEVHVGGILVAIYFDESTLVSPNIVKIIKFENFSESQPKIQDSSCRVIDL